MSFYPLSPYEFSVISVEIIGNAYEQFLGKTITIGKNHSAKIELKPEVRKAGGVYYTPEYIVDYIVANTVGEAIKGKKPEEIANIKILDPACGSGSFLLGAYKYLLNYHIEYYNKIKDRAKFKGSKEDVIKENGDLTIWIKKQILRKEADITQQYIWCGHRQQCGRGNEIIAAYEMFGGRESSVNTEQSGFI